MQTVDFWFDPLCPWAWISSRWLLEAAKVRELEPHFHVMSLGILNAGRELDPQYMEFLKFAMAPVRVVTAARLEHGDDVVLPLYTALGTRFHPGEEARELATIEKALTDVGLPTSLIEAANVETTTTRSAAATRTASTAWAWMSGRRSSPWRTPRSSVR